MKKLVPHAVSVRLEPKDMAVIIQALHQRMASLPTEGENEYGSWVDWGRLAWLSGQFTKVLAVSLAGATGKREGYPAYFRALDRAAVLIRRFVWPFKKVA